ncbi:MAG: DUF4926 domain-containing protein [Bacteroidota bacterium]
MREHDTVVLTRDLPGSSLRRGDVGAIVHIYADGKTIEVEFVTGSGATVAVETLSASDVRPLGQEEILHARELAA